MNEEITVRIYDIIGSPLGVSAEDGQVVHEKIAPLLRDGRKVALSFEKMETIISAFLNAAVGQIYGELPAERIDELLSLKDMTSEDQKLLERVVANALLYFKNRKNFDRAWKEELGDEE